MPLVKNVTQLLMGLTFAVFTTHSAYADEPYFAIFGIERQDTSISDSTFTTNSLAVRGGRWIKPGIGLQLGATIPATDDDVGSVNFSLDGLFTAGIRLESPMEKRRGAAAFVTGGFAAALIDASSEFAQSSDLFNGYFVSAGLLLGFGKKSQLNFEVSFHAVDEEVTIPALQIGYRFQF